MARHWPGYNEAYEAVSRMNDLELYEQIDCLYGRDNLSENPTHDDLLVEALRQVEVDWRVPEGYGG